MTRRAIYGREQLTRCRRRLVNCGNYRRDHRQAAVSSKRDKIRPRPNGHSRSVTI